MATNTVTDEPPEIAVTRRDALKPAGLGIGSTATFSMGVGGIRAGHQRRLQRRIRRSVRPPVRLEPREESV
ncbi:hypothetical protein [Streptomyces sp. NBC_00199]|uniref:hypothetical protein n=1 Tax=Streptomyces sp. NBC_00199 TaxID=2975678 RepID=UPI00225997E6|nr:hypothetical protein [Streptomyces sp. NBC_00199]MCX5269411.1 hypothetical protein [Streptomyces sp. NBC_00199]